MLETSISRLSIRVGLCFVVLSSPRSALGGTSSSSIEMAKTAPAVRVNDDTSRPTSIADDTYALTLTRADCRSQTLKYRFSFTVTGYGVTQTLQTWVTRSTDCAAEFTRATSATRTCWRVAADIAITNGVGRVDFTPKQLLGIDVDRGFEGNRRILKDTCEDWGTFGKGRQSMSVQFLLIDNSGRVAASATQPMYFSLVGSDAPAITKLASWNDSLKLEWEEPSHTTYATSYEFYCGINIDPVGCSSPQLEQFGSTSATSTADPIDGFVPENFPRLPKHLCGSVAGGKATSGMTLKLESGKSHAVALGVRDSFGNLGALSNYHCATPEPLTSEDLEPLTGRGCSITPQGRDAMSSTWLPLVALLTRSRRRRGTYPLNQSHEAVWCQVPPEPSEATANRRAACRRHWHHDNLE